MHDFDLDRKLIAFGWMDFTVLEVIESRAALQNLHMQWIPLKILYKHD